jgi:hypothetical protein
MNEQQLAAVKQALEALEKSLPRLAPYGEQDWLDSCKAITALQSIISQDALHKMAEESRTSGLRLDDWDKIGCVNHDCDQCKAVQEPFMWVCNSLDETEWETSKHKECEHCIPLYTAAQPVPVKTYHDGKPWPVAPKPWVGLTDEENLDLISDAKGMGGRIRADGQLLELLKMHQAKLREKNT